MSPALFAKMANPAACFENFQGVNVVEDDRLLSCLSDLTLRDMATKVQILQSLSSYLACVAATMSVSPEDMSVLAWVGDSKVRLNYREVMELHGLLFRELLCYTEILASTNETRQFFKEAEIHQRDRRLSTSLLLEAVSQTLRCCIRILPLLDCFDTGVSFRGAAMLDNLMQQLFSPAVLTDNLPRLGKLSSHDNSQDFVIPGKRSRECVGSVDKFSSVYAPEEDSFSESSEETMQTQQRLQIFLALLQVYMDELLLSPDFGARLLVFQDDAYTGLTKDSVWSKLAWNAEAPLEVAFVYARLSCLFENLDELARPNVVEGMPLYCNLSVPAGLLLLEALADERIPPLLMSHIVRLVSTVLRDTTIIADQHGVSLGPPESNNIFVGGVDWVYCLKRVLMTHEEMNVSQTGGNLPFFASVDFASALFEQSMILFCKFSLSSTSSGDEKSGRPADSAFLRYCERIVSLHRDSSCSKVMIETSSPSGEICLRARSGEVDPSLLPAVTASYSDFHHKMLETLVLSDNPLDYVGHHQLRPGSLGTFKVGERDETLLIRAILNLGTTSLRCITREFGQLLRPSNYHLSPTALRCDIVDKLMASVSLSLTSFLPLTRNASVSRKGNESDEKSTFTGQSCLITSLSELILFFTDVFCYEVLSGTGSEQLEDYFQLVESLVALLLVVDTSKNLLLKASGKMPPHCQPYELKDSKEEVLESSTKTLQCSASTISCLGGMVCRLQTMLRELISRQRPIPELFLKFVLEQVSRQDGLHIAALAFKSGMEHLFDGGRLHRLHRNGVPYFGSYLLDEGLNSQILKLALQTANKVSSCSTFVGYLCSALVELLPITITLPLKEIAESLKCYMDIASAFILACKFAGSEQSMPIKKDHDCYVGFMSRLCEGLERLFVEGTAVIQWITNWSYLKTVSCPTTSSGDGTSMDTKIVDHVTCKEEGQLHFSSRFLVQVDVLRTAMVTLISTTGSLLIPDLELNSVVLKATMFSNAFSRLRMMVDKPVHLWKFFLFLQEEMDVCTMNGASGTDEHETKVHMKIDSADVTTDLASCSKCASEPKDYTSNEHEAGIPAEDSQKNAYKQNSLYGQAHQAPPGQCMSDSSTDIGGENGRAVLGSLLWKMRPHIGKDEALCKHVLNKVQDGTRQEVHEATIAGNLAFTREIPVSGSQTSDEMSTSRTSEVRDSVPICGDITLDQGAYDSAMEIEGELRPVVIDACAMIVEVSAKDDVQSQRVCSEVVGQLDLEVTEGIRPDESAVLCRSIELCDTLLTQSEAGVLSSHEDLKVAGCSAKALAIAQRLRQTQQPSAKKENCQRTVLRNLRSLDIVPKATRKSQPSAEPGRGSDPDCVAIATSDLIGHSYVECVVKSDAYQETFDDLKAFIVCKKGRDYRKWLKCRQKLDNVYMEGTCLDECSRKETCCCY